jgi:hypothetical protein
MNVANIDKVNNYLTDIQLALPQQYEIVNLIRAIFNKSNKNLVEDIKYGGLTFNLENALVGGIYTYKGHISIEFSKGASFTDDDSLLDGNGKKRRHLKIYTTRDIVQKTSEYFISQAANN